MPAALWRSKTLPFSLRFYELALERLIRELGIAISKLIKSWPLYTRAKVKCISFKFNGISSGFSECKKMGLGRNLLTH